ncbi:peptidoglycan editing factor PgeF [Hahella ganghwensis]|uniref:peptidoglycan editing factor PgeF n=1 Tax=Hahella ganghwensis TaxID=286420 RepID=UPI00035D1651|nr:peptidoglycan editing factor PgeF [Hahella ganghwensis]
MTTTEFPLFITPDWPEPPGVKAISTLRQGGISLPPYQSFNLGSHVGDHSEAVKFNRERLASEVGLSPGSVQWLKQVHGTRVIDVDQVVVDEIEADAAYTTRSGVACCIMTADCLPVLFASIDGSEVAVAHAGWRGLAGGVLENTLSCFTDPNRVVVWLGPAIGPDAFEVGDEVMEVFAEKNAKMADAFTASAHQKGKWFADIYLLARLTLNSAGISNVYGGQCCTFSDADRFFSYRRDGVTGRMATLIWKN